MRKTLLISLGVAIITGLLSLNPMGGLMFGTSMYLLLSLYYFRKQTIPTLNDTVITIMSVILLFQILTYYKGITKIIFATALITPIAILIFSNIKKTNKYDMIKYGWGIFCLLIISYVQFTNITEFSDTSSIINILDGVVIGVLLFYSLVYMLTIGL